MSDEQIQVVQGTEKLLHDALAENMRLHSECREQRRENTKLRERVAELLKAATLFRLHGLPPHDVSGSAAWDTAVELLTKEGGDDEQM